MSSRLLFRWAVFLLAAFYTIRMILVGPYDGFGGPFRYLTIWALLLSFFCASRMIAREEGRTTQRFDGIVAATAAINAMVVILYWRLYFADPTSVTRNGELGKWWLEMYLHGLGPLLQWIDAGLIHRAYRAPIRAAGWLLGIIVALVAWWELVIGPLNDAPEGSVTSGLPYRFLNNMEFGARVEFYLSNVVAGLVVMGIFLSLSWGLSRLFRRPTAP